MAKSKKFHLTEAHLGSLKARAKTLCGRSTEGTWVYSNSLDNLFKFDGLCSVCARKALSDKRIRNYGARIMIELHMDSAKRNKWGFFPFLQVTDDYALSMQAGTHAYCDPAVNFPSLDMYHSVEIAVKSHKVGDRFSKITNVWNFKLNGGNKVFSDAGFEDCTSPVASGATLETMIPVVEYLLKYDKIPESVEAMKEVLEC